jgi:hypothetical protein
MTTLTKYLESIFLACLSHGTLQKKRNDKLCFAAKHSFATNSKSTTGKSSRSSRTAKSAIIVIVGIKIRIAGLLKTAGILMMAIASASKLVAPTTRTLGATARPLLITASSRSNAIYMVPTASIPTLSAVRNQQIKQARMTTTTTMLKNASTTCTTS